LEQPGESEGGWTFGRIVGLIVGLVGMGGLGFCSLCGLVIGAGSPGMMSAVLLFAIPGLGVAFLFFLLVRAMVRRARKPPAPPAPPPPPSPLP
jgi:hypothetical protein